MKNLKLSFKYDHTFATAKKNRIFLKQQRVFTLARFEGN